MKEIQVEDIQFHIKYEYAEDSTITAKHYRILDNNTLLGNGIVYDINNNMDEELAKDPLTYQKRRRG